MHVYTYVRVILFLYVNVYVCMYLCACVRVSCAFTAGLLVFSTADVDVAGAAVQTGKDVFVTLYTTWTHSPIATFSLCLLAQAYELSCSLVSKL